MARSYGHIMSAIWNDPEFSALSALSQRAYLMLITQAEITSAGTLALTMKRWSRYASDTPSDALSDALSDLERNRFIAYDDDTEELVVRSFVKWDGGANNEKRRPAITAAANAVVSPKIRAVLRTELDKLDVPHSIRDTPSDALRHTPRVVVTEVGKEPQPTTHNPETSTLVPAPQRAANGTRLREDWRPTDEDVRWSRSKGIPDSQAKDETEKFINHFVAKTGKDATKLNWSRAWQNWLLTAIERNGIRREGSLGGASQKAADWLSLAEPSPREISGRSA